MKSSEANFFNLTDKFTKKLAKPIVADKLQAAHTQTSYCYKTRNTPLYELLAVPQYSESHILYHPKAPQRVPLSKTL